MQTGFDIANPPYVQWELVNPSRVDMVLDDLDSTSGTIHAHRSSATGIDTVDLLTL